jgi:hypothetical protein
MIAGAQAGQDSISQNGASSNLLILKIKLIKK